MISGQIERLGNLCTFLNGGTPSKQVLKYYEGDVPWITGTDVNEPVVRSARNYITKEAIENSATNFVSKGTLLLVTRTSVGKVAVAGMDLCFSQDITAIIPNEIRLDSAYLFQFLASNQGYLTYRQRGATIKGITREVLTEMVIPLPPIAEQKRIAAILDEADALRRKRREAIAKLDTLLQSVFLDMFGDPVTNPKGWKTERFEALLSIPLRNGVSPSNFGKYSGKVLTLSAITRGSFDAKAVKDAFFAEEASGEKFVDTLDFLICRGNGNIELVGQGHYPTHTFEDTVFPDTMIAARVDKNKVVPQFLETYWAMPEIRRQIESAARTTNGTFKINQGMLEAIEIMLPFWPIQKQFAKRFAEVQVIRRQAEIYVTEVEKLFTTLQHQAFNFQTTVEAHTKTHIQPCLTLDF